MESVISDLIWSDLTHAWNPYTYNHQFFFFSLPRHLVNRHSQIVAIGYSSMDNMKSCILSFQKQEFLRNRSFHIRGTVSFVLISCKDIQYIPAQTHTHTHTHNPCMHVIIIAHVYGMNCSACVIFLLLSFICVLLLPHPHSYIIWVWVVSAHKQNLSSRWLQTQKPTHPFVQCLFHILRF